MKLVLTPILVCFFSTSLIAQTTIKQVQLKNFQLQSSYIIKESGKEISTQNYHETNYWFPVQVPSTVLTGLVKNNVYPNPYIGMNNMFIPDASDSFNHEYHLEQYSHIPNVPNPWNKAYWYRTTFDVPITDKNQLFQLIFKGINYRADIWLNGKLIADSSTIVGMFAEFVLDVSNAINIGNKNVLAVKIYPLDYAGLPAHPQLNALGDFYANGGPTGDIGKNVTMLCSAGWDWIPEVHDRNMGIWQPVFLRTSGKLIIQHPHIITDLPSLPDTNVAKLALHVTVANQSNTTTNGKLHITISPETFAGNSFTITQVITLTNNEHKEISFTANNFKELIIQHPHLWWPVGYGKPNLYKIKIELENNAAISDQISFLFGIRTTTSKFNTVNGWGKREFYVNGQRIHLTGGAWVPDMMLQEDSVRFDNELLLCKNANLNLLRIWGGGVAPPDMFFDLADKYGLLVWEDFWITGDTNGEFKGSAEYPYQGNVFTNNVISTIYRLRNHPSLLVWTGGNEGHARKELYNAMRNNVIALDGTRPFIPSSSGFAKLSLDWKGSWPDGLAGGVYSGGSYKWEDPLYYFTKINTGKDWLFKDETGIPSQPPYETLHKIIPNLTPDSTLPFPLNNSWGYHDACSGNGHYELYYNEMIQRFGTPTDLKDFSYKMQLMNADGYRGIFEAAAHKLNDNGGVMLWKLNPAFPSVIWQIFDYYYAPNAGYYYIQQTCQPLHIQFNADDSSVAIINRTYQPIKNISVDTKIYSIDGKKIFQHNDTVNTTASNVQKILSAASILKNSKEICFIVLNAKDISGKNISHNVYWMAPNHNFKELKNMPSAKVKTQIIKKEKLNTNEQWTIQISNSTNQLAFFIHAKFTDGDEEIFPTFWSNNYFSLAPGENIIVTASIPQSILHDKYQKLEVEGWNIATQ